MLGQVGKPVCKVCSIHSQCLDRFQHTFEGYCVGQVQVIFTLLNGVDGVPSEHLTYVDWFSKFTTSDCDHWMFKLGRSLEDGGRIASIVPISTIRCSVHLFPKFGLSVPEGWSLDNVLEKCGTFYLNPFTNRHMYFIL